MNDENAKLRGLIGELVEMVEACVPAARHLNTNAFILVNRARVVLEAFETGAKPRPIQDSPLPTEIAGHTFVIDAKVWHALFTGLALPLTTFACDGVDDAGDPSCKPKLHARAAVAIADACITELQKEKPQ
jgi:hypothetical protein